MSATECPCPPTGHECRPNWVTETEWGDPVAERPEQA